MKIIKNILIGLGVIFILLIGLFVFLGSESIEFRDRHAEFVESFVKDFSNDWEVSTIHKLVTNEMLVQMQSQNGQQALSVMSALGKLESISDLTLTNYSTKISGDTGVFQFKGQFSNGAALVQVIVIEKDEVVRIHNLHINTISNISPIPTKHKA